MSSQAIADCSTRIALRCRKTLHVSGVTTTSVNEYRPRAWTGDPSGDSVFARTPVAAMMTRVVFCVRADVRAEVVRRLLAEKAIGGVPIVDEHGIPIGFVSRTDLMHESPSAKVTAADLSLPVAFTVSEHAPVMRAAAIMTREKVHHLAVCADSGEVVGVISTFDVTRFLAKHGGPR
jgi:CBS domain-containing protein